MSGAQAGPLGLFVVASGGCRPKFYPGVDEHEVVETWPPHQRNLKLIITLVDRMKRGQVGTGSIAHSAAYEERLFEAAVDQANKV